MIEGNGIVDNYFYNSYTSIFDVGHAMFYKDLTLYNDVFDTKFVGITPQVDRNGRFKQKKIMWEENNNKREKKKKQFQRNLFVIQLTSWNNRNILFVILYRTVFCYTCSWYWRNK